MKPAFFQPRLTSAARCGLVLALACLGLGGTIRPASAAPPITFNEPSLVPTLPTTDTQRSFNGVAKGDFNGDGHLDVAALYTDHANNNNFGEIEITLGNGDGTFQTPTKINIPQTSTGGEVDGIAILAKDFNGDGKLDLAVTTSNSTLLIFMGKGDGTFQTPVSYALPANANGLQAGDVNGDGKLDLVVLLSSANQVGVMPGNGDGTFELPTTYAVDANPQDMALADVDKKKGLDIVVCTYDGASIDCLLNNSNGTFAAQRSTRIGVNFNGLYVADFDGDGKPDVVAGGTGQVNGGHFANILFLKGVGDGTFLSPSASNDFPSAGNFGQRVLSENVAPDLNGDGHPDVLFSCGSENLFTEGISDGHGGFSLQYFAADGGSGIPNTIISGPQPTSFVFGNFTSQARPDIVVASRNTNGGPGGLSLLRANPAKPGAFLTAYAYSTGDPTYNVGNLYDLDFALGDFLHNGKVSLATTGNGANAFRGIYVVPGLGDGTLAPTLPYPLAPIQSNANDPGNVTALYGLASADFNGDGLPDLVYTTGGGEPNSAPYEIYSFGQGNGQFGSGGAISPPSGDTPDNSATEIAAFGGPGHLGFANMVNVNGTNHIQVFLYGTGGANTFSMTADLAPATISDAHGFAAGDFDGDGKADLIIHTGNPERLNFYKGNGDGTFQPPVQSSPGIAYLFSSKTADLNGDGNLDLIFGTYGGIIVLLGNGDGTFQQETTYGAPGNEDIQGIAVADFNGDGHPDVAVAGADDAVVFPGVGDGTLGAPLSFATGFQGSTAYVHVADLNGDGRPDLVYSSGGNANNIHFAVLLNGGGKLSDKHLLWDNTSGEAALWNVFADGTFTSSTFGPFAGWTARAVSGNPDSTSHMLWTNTNGEVSLYTVTLGGTVTHTEYGPFPGYTAVALSQGPDGKSRILWNQTSGQASLWTVSVGGVVTHREYGPFKGWTANAVATGADNFDDLLWNNVSGQAAGWRVNPADGTYTSQLYGPYTGWKAVSVSAGTDSVPHLLWDNVNGTTNLWNASFTSPGFTFHLYGPYGGWTAKAIATGPDTLTDILWDNTNGTTSLWGVDTSTGQFSAHQYGPYSGWSAVAVSAGP